MAGQLSSEAVAGCNTAQGHAEAELVCRLVQEVDHLCDCYGVEEFIDVLRRAERYMESNGWTIGPRLAAMRAIDAYLSERGR